MAEIETINEYDTIPEELLGAYVLDENGEKIYVWSHIQKVRYNAEMTLEDKLKKINDFIDNIDDKIDITSETIYNALGFTPANPNAINFFNKQVTFGDNIVIGSPNNDYATYFRPLYDDNGVQIGHVLD